MSAESTFLEIEEYARTQEGKRAWGYEIRDTDDMDGPSDLD